MAAEIGWDDPLPQTFLKEWSQWQNDLGNLSEFAVPRFYRHIVDQPVNIQLHIFGDASERAFGSVTYFRLTHASGSVRCSFITAKTRVAPQKKLSIPKLELQAAVLSTRISDMVIREHDYVIDAVHFWSDSIVVLCWLHGPSKRQPPFIANRIGEILDTTDPSQWHHCPGKLNPADDCSRGLSAAEITSTNRWMNGPAYLLLSEEKWPKKDLKLDAQNVLDDDTTKDKDPTDLWSCVATQTVNSFVDLAKYSTLSKVLRVIAYVVRFVRNCRKPKSKRQSGPFLVDEIKDAKKLIVKIAQLKSFPHEVAALKKGRPVSSKSKLVSLSPFLDDDGIILVGGRIGKAVIPFEAKHPIVLAPQHELTRLVIMDYHSKLLHEGVNHVRNDLRQQYWVLRGRATIRKFLHQCALCKKRRVQPEPPRMAGLPRDRLQVAPAFSKVGVDYFGPLTVKNLRRREKRYGCLFTCLVTRGVHLEVAHSLETDSFIMCL